MNTNQEPSSALRSGDLLDEIRAIITGQINRHVAMTDTHRAWLGDDISTRICEIVNAAITKLSDPIFDREGQAIDDKRRLDWLGETASGINWQLSNTHLITRDRIDKCLAEADREEAADTANEP